MTTSQSPTTRSFKGFKNRKLALKLFLVKGKKMMYEELYCVSYSSDRGESFCMKIELKFLLFQENIKKVLPGCKTC